jgi:molybdopterin-guanine dinucleotide biosynthesis protein A
MIATNVTTANLTGLVLAGGRGTRMGGVDKGLQLLHGEPLAAHVLKRLAAQTGPLLISANRHAEVYAGLGAPFGAAVVADTLAGFPAGTEFVLSAPCDSPGLPADLAARLALAFDSDEVDIATVTTTDAYGESSIHPVFALLRTSLADDLAAFLEAGERKVRAWYARHRTVEVAFPDERAFYNINSLQELADLERH